ncbi:MAG: MBL fold metallo-hydrolase [Chloroflexi bacterium]|nr:MBL fold metallo-hydrolase [Chloroflexota bacterium]
MFLKQYYLDCLAHASYLIGDEKAGVAAVIDPRRDIDEYVQDAAAAGMTIKHVLLTHFHADFVSGHLDFRDELGAEIHLGAKAIAEYAFTPAGDGGVLELGAVQLRFLETPGHTPESVCAVVADTAAKPDEPYAVLTGDTLFIGDVGRPDLVASEGLDANTLAGWLYDSLHDKLLPLPDATLVYPAHGAGSLCGRNLSTDTFSTMGTQRLYNYALQDMTKDEFIQMVTKDQPTAPNYFGWDALLNKKERPFSVRTVELQRLGLGGFLSIAEAGAQILDVRDPVDFAAGHLNGAISVGLDGAFAQWAGAVLDFEKPIIIVVYPGGEAETVTRLARVGLQNVIGFLSSGMGAVASYPELVETTVRITAKNLAERVAEPEPPVVIDVRGQAEWKAGHIEGSVNIPLQELSARLGDLPQDRSIALQCLGGYRSSVAASILQRAGITNLVELTGGLQAWEASKLPTVAEAT